MSEYYSDLNLNFELQRDGQLKKDINEDAVRNSLINILSTMQGSRRMLPTFALNVYSLLFDPLDEITARDIGERMLDCIRQWEDRVILEEIAVIPNYDYSRYDVKIVYRIRNTQETQELDYVIQKL